MSAPAIIVIEVEGSEFWFEARLQGNRPVRTYRDRGGKTPSPLGRGRPFGWKLQVEVREAGETREHARSKRR